MTAKRNQLVNRGRVAATQSQVNNALQALDAGDPASAIGRYEESIRRQEATVRGQQELSPLHPWKPSSRPLEKTASRPKWKHASPR